MDIIKQLNNAIAYIEENLCDEIETSRIVETSLSTMKYYMILTGQTLNPTLTESLFPFPTHFSRAGGSSM